MSRAGISALIRAVLSENFPESANLRFNLSEPATGIEADYSSNVALLLAPALRQSPPEAARVIADKALKKDGGKLLRDVGVAKNGFLNFFFREDHLKSMAARVLSEKDNFGKEDRGGAPPVMIEFVSANPTGPLHIGHGRGAALGDSLARLYRQGGYRVQTEYYINDVGVQMKMLASSVQARYLQRKGDTQAQLPENGYKGDYIEKIAEVMEQQGRTDFDKFPREYILDWIRKDLADFGVTIEQYFSEASLHKDGSLAASLKILEDKGALKEKDGALWFMGQLDASEEKELDKDRVLKKSDGRYTYFASDIAYHRNKFERGFGKCIDIWGHDHHGYVPRVESALAMLGYSKSFLHILLYQLVSLKRDGKKVAMSTRSGEFVTLKEIVDEVGRDASRFFFAMRNPNSQLEFDVDLAKKQSNENPVYYVQYVHARIASIFREAEKRGIEIPSPLRGGGQGEGGSLWNGITFVKEERDLALKLTYFKDVLEASLNISSPHVVSTYLVELAVTFHKFYDKHRVLEAEPAVLKSRLALLQATAIIVKLGLSLLGVSAPEKM